MKTIGNKVTNSLQILTDFVDGEVLAFDNEGNVVSSALPDLLLGESIEVTDLTLTGNLSIGTTPGTNRLNVSGNTGLDGNLIFLPLAGGSGANRLIDFGNNFGSPAIHLYNGGSAGTRYGWGLQAGEMQFYLNGAVTTNHFSWNSGGDLQASGTNELMRLYATGNLALGTTSGSSKLNVVGTTSLTGLVSVAGNINLVPDGSNNRTINFGLGFGTSAITLYDGGSAGSRYGWGLRASEMQFYIPSGGTTHYSWNVGGDLQTSGTNEIMRLTSAGNLGIGTTSPNANAILDISSTTKAFMPPRMTTTQKNAIASPTAGMVVYDSTLNKLSVRTASAWETITSA